MSRTYIAKQIANHVPGTHTIDSSTKVIELNELLGPCKNIDKDGTSNIIDPKMASYKVPDLQIPEFFRLLDAIRIDGLRVHFQERQPDYSGLMLDFDIDHTSATSLIDEDMLQYMTREITDIVVKTIEAPPKVVHVGILKNPTPRDKTSENSGITTFREGFHLLFPELRLKKVHKRYILSVLAEKMLDEEWRGEYFAGIELRNIANIVDYNAASVPVHFVGSCKRDPSKLAEPLIVYRYKYNKFGNSVIAEPVPLSAFKNICWEFSLNYAMPSDLGGVLQKTRFELKSDIKLPLELINDRTDSVDERIDSDIIRLRASNPNADRIIRLVDMLNIRRSADRNMWLCMMHVIAGLNGDYSAVAHMFSAKCPEKYKPQEVADLYIKFRAITQQGTETRLERYARDDNPEEYLKISRNAAAEHLFLACTQPLIEGNVGHYNFAKAIQVLFPDKFVFSRTQAEKIGSWYEFITEEDASDAVHGQIYKYRKSDKPVKLNVYISDRLTKLSIAVFDRLKNIAANSEEPIKGKYINIGTNFSLQVQSLMNHAPKQSIIRECEAIFYKETFASEVDLDECVLGVGNGILELGKQPNLITGQHPYKTTRFIETRYVPYDPELPNIKKMEEILRNLFTEDEQDKYEYVMCWFAASLDFRKKPELLLIMYGGGSNGKTMIQDGFSNMMKSQNCDNGFAKVHSGRLLTDPPATPTGPNTAMIAFKWARANMYDEFGENNIINSLSLKTLLGNTWSGAEKYEKQQSFSIRGSHTAATNHVLRVSKPEFATMRRLKYMEFRKSFRYINCPMMPYDPEDPLHGIKDDRIKNEFIPSIEGREAFLSIMVKWYAIYANVYDSNIANVPSPTIEAETERYHNSQNVIDQWVTERVVKTVDTNVLAPIGDFIAYYTQWYNTQFPQVNWVAREIEEQLIKSRLVTICDIVEVGGIKHIKGARPILHNKLPDEGEILIKNVIEQKTKGTRKFVSQDHRMKFADYLQSLDNTLGALQTGSKVVTGTGTDTATSDVAGSSSDDNTDNTTDTRNDDINNVDVDVSDDGF